jgi:drug/metabolite transporter superfamily protein YnfA
MTMLLLMLAALMEAGGDALVRAGLRSPGGIRVSLLVAGAVVLFAYGCLVNGSSWDFGKLLGIYVVFFFVVAQIIGWAAFHQTPGRGILLGGACIVMGGVIVALSPA